MRPITGETETETAADNGSAEGRLDRQADQWNLLGSVMILVL